MNNLYIKEIKKIITSTLILLFFTYANLSFAATLQVSPSSSKISVGNITSVKFIVNTDGKTINNADGIVQFPSDLLEVISVSKSSSIFTLWVEDPKFSNSLGQITFNGGLPNPGYNGYGGEIITVTFKGKKQGIANILYSESAVRENNGLGTDILTSKGTGSIQIDLSNEVINVKPAQGLPDKPIVLSSTHPDSDRWYQGTLATFSWVIPDDVISIQTLFNKSQSSIPTVAYDNTVSQRTVNNLTDGVMYFHIRYVNTNGSGPTTNYKVQVDNTPPNDFELPIRKEGVRDIVKLNAQDKTSGIDSYSIKIDSESSFRINNDSLKNNEYVLPVKNPGEHDIIVTAYDKAGNYTTQKSSYSSNDITSPNIQVNKDSIVKGESITISGSTDYSSSEVRIFIQENNRSIKTYTTTTDKDGKFVFNTDEFKSTGIMNIWSINYFSDSIKSPISNKISIKVNDTTLVKTTKSVSYTLLSLIIVILLLIILILLLYTGWHKFFGLKRRISRELNDMTKEIHKAMDLFKDELKDQLDVLEKTRIDRDLNRKEEKIFKELQLNIDNIDDFIDKKIKKIK